MNEQNIRDGIQPAGMSDDDYAAARKKLASEIETSADARERARREKIESYFNAHPDLAKTSRDAIKNRWFSAGMSREDVEFSMGEPRRKVQSGGIGQSAWETWYYYSVILDFRDGTVAHWTIVSGGP